MESFSVIGKYSTAKLIPHTTNLVNTCLAIRLSGFVQWIKVLGMPADVDCEYRLRLGNWDMNATSCEGKLYINDVINTSDGKVLAGLLSSDRSKLFHELYLVNKLDT